MEWILIMQYLAAIAVVGLVSFGLSRLKRWLLLRCAAMQNKPPSQL